MLFAGLVACNENAGQAISVSSNQKPITDPTEDPETAEIPSEAAVGTINGNPFGISSVFIVLNDAPVGEDVTSLNLLTDDYLFCGFNTESGDLSLPPGYAVNYILKIATIDEAGVIQGGAAFAFSSDNPMAVTEIASYLPGRMACTAKIYFNGKPFQQIDSPIVTATLDQNEDVVLSFENQEPTPAREVLK